jgi:hypothetical protein
MDVERRIGEFVRDTRLAVEGMTVPLEDLCARYVAWCDMPGAVAPKNALLRSVFVAGFGARVVPSVQGPVVVFPQPPPTHVRDVVATSKIAESRDDVAEWAKKTLTVTGNREDVLLVSELKALYTGDRRKFKLRLKAYLSVLEGVGFKDVGRVKKDDVSKPMRDVVRGARLS